MIIIELRTVIMKKKAFFMCHAERFQHPRYKKKKKKSFRAPLARRYRLFNPLQKLIPVYCDQHGSLRGFVIKKKKKNSRRL